MSFGYVIYRAAALVMGLAVATGSLACSFEQAHYRYSANPDIEVSFRKVGKQPDWISDLALQLKIRGSGRSYWFLFDGGSARYVNMISVEDVTAPGWTAPDGDGSRGRGTLGSMHFFAWSKKDVFFETIPKSGQPAPDTIFLPDLAETLWYRADPRVGVGHGLFVRDRCAKPL